jgi:hypothetical protein
MVHTIAWFLQTLYIKVQKAQVEKGGNSYKIMRRATFETIGRHWLHFSAPGSVIKECVDN